MAAGWFFFLREMELIYTISRFWKSVPVKSHRVHKTHSSLTIDIFGQSRYNDTVSF